MLEVKNICKRFGDMYALNHFNLSMEKGTVHGLVGENGAGKSTLIKILTGVYHLDSGNCRQLKKGGDSCTYTKPGAWNKCDSSRQKPGAGF